MPRILQEPLQVATVTNFCLVTALVTNSVEPRFIFCLQHQSKFFINNICKHSHFVFENSWICSPVGHDPVATQICKAWWVAVLWSQISAFCLIIASWQFQVFRLLAHSSFRTGAVRKRKTMPGKVTSDVMMPWGFNVCHVHI